MLGTGGGGGGGGGTDETRVLRGFGMAGCEVRTRVDIYHYYKISEKVAPVQASTL